MGTGKGFAQRAKRRFGTGTMSEMTVIYGNRRVTVRGCRKILSYQPDEIRMLLPEREICLRGQGLCCVCFGERSSTVEGIITGVELCEREKKP